MALADITRDGALGAIDECQLRYQVEGMPIS